MLWSLYKKYFSVDINYEQDSSTSNKDVMIIPSASTLVLMKNHDLGYHSYEGGILVYFQGSQDESDAGKIVPQFVLDDNQALYFKLYFNSSALLNNLNFFPDTSDVQYSFPQIYLGEKKDSTSTSVELIYQKIILKPVIFSVNVKDTDCGLSSADEASWKIKNQDGNIISENISKKNDDDYFNCSIDLSNQQSGVYTLEIGSFITNYFIDTTSEFNGCTALIKILKNSFLPFDTNWLDTNYIKFTKTINKK
ncbi:MAG TPA: hypothetical protein PKK00_08685 [Bacteroidales bacterium]|nr:hypothetical protein [Bacteroidales bacterium]HPS17453.1 hypothetical protein [Bacteroidales bacterium]